MKVILLQDIKKVGRKNEIKEVANGLVNNLLLPKGLVMIATKENLRVYEAKQKELDAQRAIHDELVRKTLADIDGKTVTMKEKANEKGHLFKKIHTKEVVEAAKLSLGLELDPDWLSLEPIKELGTYEIKASYGLSKAKFTIKIEA